jgi:hypothetical protein
MLVELACPLGQQKKGEPSCFKGDTVDVEMSNHKMGKSSICILCPCASPLAVPHLISAHLKNLGSLDSENIPECTVKNHLIGKGQSFSSWAMVRILSSGFDFLHCRSRILPPFLFAKPRSRADWTILRSRALEDVHVGRVLGV